MTEKRFTKYVPNSYNYTYIITIIDNEKKKETGNVDEIVDMLNELSDKNELLKHQNDNLVNMIARVQCRADLIKEENELLKEEKELLKNKLDRIEDILPHYLSCAEISEFRGKTVKEDLALMKCWNKRGIKND